jgi:hypothetical protein
MSQIDPHRLVFLDESGAKTNMTRLYGRIIGGGRLVGRTPHGHWSTTTILSSLRLDGSTAAMVIEGATDRDVFEAYVQEVLIPSLRPGDIVVMDNLAPHKSPRIIAAIEAASAEVWFLSPYSPDLNPIEKSKTPFLHGAVVEDQSLASAGESTNRKRSAASHRRRTGSHLSVGCPRVVQLLWVPL